VADEKDVLNGNVPHLVTVTRPEGSRRNAKHAKLIAGIVYKELETKP
jgi:hypothetical protein